MITTEADDKIALHYQPILDFTGRVVGLEALMRWHHRRRGTISPEAFIPVFEQSGLILPLSRWALSEACAEAARWTTKLNVAVNLSPIQFQYDDIPALVRQALGQTGLAPERLELEITEAAINADPLGALSTLLQLEHMGVHLVLDDFGIGDSKPTLLNDYPFSKVKIDTSFIAKLEISASARRILKMIIEHAHSLDRIVVAEGVETDAQVALLADARCDLMQGFLSGRPAAIESFAALTGASDMGSASAAVLADWQMSFEQSGGLH